MPFKRRRSRTLDPSSYFGWLEKVEEQPPPPLNSESTGRGTGQDEAKYKLKVGNAIGGMQRGFGSGRGLDASVDLDVAAKMRIQNDDGAENETINQTQTHTQSVHNQSPDTTSSNPDPLSYFIRSRHTIPAPDLSSDSVYTPSVPSKVSKTGENRWVVDVEFAESPATSPTTKQQMEGTDFGTQDGARGKIRSASPLVESANIKVKPQNVIPSKSSTTEVDTNKFSPSTPTHPQKLTPTIGPHPHLETVIGGHTLRQILSSPLFHKGHPTKIRAYIDKLKAAGEVKVGSIELEELERVLEEVEGMERVLEERRRKAKVKDDESSEAKRVELEGKDKVVVKKPKGFLQEFYAQPLAKEEEGKAQEVREMKVRDRYTDDELQAEKEELFKRVKMGEELSSTLGTNSPEAKREVENRLEKKIVENTSNNSSDPFSSSLTSNEATHFGRKMPGMDELGKTDEGISISGTVKIETIASASSSLANTTPSTMPKIETTETGEEQRANNERSEERTTESKLYLDTPMTLKYDRLDPLYDPRKYLKALSTLPLTLEQLKLIAKVCSRVKFPDFEGPQMPNNFFSDLEYETCKRADRQMDPLFLTVREIVDDAVDDWRRKSSSNLPLPVENEFLEFLANEDLRLGFEDIFRLAKLCGKLKLDPKMMDWKKGGWMRDIALQVAQRDEQSRNLGRNKDIQRMESKAVSDIPSENISPVSPSSIGTSDNSPTQKKSQFKPSKSSFLDSFYDQPENKTVLKKTAPTTVIPPEDFLPFLRTTRLPITLHTRVSKILSKHGLDVLTLGAMATDDLRNSGLLEKGLRWEELLQIGQRLPEGEEVIESEEERVKREQVEKSIGCGHKHSHKTHDVVAQSQNRRELDGEKGKDEAPIDRPKPNADVWSQLADEGRSEFSLNPLPFRDPLREQVEATKSSGILDRVERFTLKLIDTIESRSEDRRILSKDRSGSASTSTSPSTPISVKPSAKPSAPLPPLTKRWPTSSSPDNPSPINDLFYGDQVPPPPKSAIFPNFHPPEDTNLGASLKYGESLRSQVYKGLHEHIRHMEEGQNASTKNEQPRTVGPDMNVEIQKDFTEKEKGAKVNEPTSILHQFFGLFKGRSAGSHLEESKLGWSARIKRGAENMDERFHSLDRNIEEKMREADRASSAENLPHSDTSHLIPNQMASSPKLNWSPRSVFNSGASNSRVRMARLAINIMMNRGRAGVRRRRVTAPKPRFISKKYPVYKVPHRKPPGGTGCTIM